MNLFLLLLLLLADDFMLSNRAASMVAGLKPSLLGCPISRGARAESIRFRVADELFLDGIELQLALENPSKRSCMTGNVRPPHDVRIGCGLAP